MTTYLAAIGLIFVLVLFGIGIDRLYRAFAAKYPQLGPYRKADGCGCCKSRAACDQATDQA